MGLFGAGKFKKKFGLNKYIIISSCVFLFVGLNSSVYAATIDDVRELAGKERLDIKYSPEKQRKIEIEYKKVENNNLLADMLDPLDQEALYEQKEALKENLQKQVDEAEKELKKKFVDGGSVEEVLAIKTKLDDLRHQLMSLGESREVITLKKMKNPWEKEYLEMKNILSKVQSYKNIGVIGNDLRFPVQGYFNLTSPFGLRVHPITGEVSFHRGLDFGAPEGVYVYALWSGEVRKARNTPSGGNTIEIEHEDGLSTRYLHLSEMLVKEGDVVNQYTPIGRVGSTGNSTGSHLHLEVWLDGEPVDPIYFFGAKGRNLLKMFLSMNPNHPSASVLRERLGKIKDEPEFGVEEEVFARVDEIFRKSGEVPEGAIQLKVKDGNTPRPEEDFNKYLDSDYLSSIRLRDSQDEGNRLW